jgi:hypothetical protein
MDGDAGRRILSVLVAYVLAAWVVVLLADWLAVVLALPPMFDSMLRWGIGLGLPVALLMAWKYPEIGHHGGQG